MRTLVIAGLLLASASAGAQQANQPPRKPTGQDASPAGTSSPQMDPGNGNTLVAFRIERIKADNLAATLIAGTKPTDDAYKQGKKLYDDAMAKYNAYLSQALLDMVQAHKSDLKQSADSAYKAGQDFESFVNKTTATKTLAGILATAEQLVEFATKLVDYFKDRAQAKRKAYADAVKPDILWRKWQDIAKESGNQ